VRIRSQLLLMSAVVFVPSFLAAGFAVQKVRDAQRDAALRGLRETVRATSLMVDGQIQRSLGALTALSRSPRLAARDFKGLYGEAQAIDQPPDVWTIIVDAQGVQRVNTSVPFGSAPPPSSLVAPRIAKALASGKPIASDLYTGAATGKLLTTLAVPVRTPDGDRFVLMQAFSVDLWRSKAFEPTRDRSWTTAVIDSTGRFISRSRSPQTYLGKPARPELAAAAAGSSDGLIHHRTLDGIDSYDAFAHSALTGWTIAVAAPVDSIEASATQAVTWLAIGLFSALILAALGAALVGGGLIRALESAAASARGLARGHPVAARSTPIHEVSALNQAFADAARVLAEEERARGVAEADRERLLANETEARKAAQSENASKDKFVAMLGHELRNPLSAIAGAAEVLDRGVGTPEQRGRMLRVILRQSRHLAHIVDDLLEAGRMLTGKIELRASPIELAGRVGACVDAMRLTSEARSHSIVFESEEVWVEADPARVEQIVGNLIGNALKFSPAQAPISVRVWAIGTQAAIAVADRGPGIPEHLAERVFEPFVQGPGPVDGMPSGLGVGLALVRQLVELHGGKVVVSATPGGGATLTVVLPRATRQGGPLAA
jgi:signal transduction histidine kinase